MIPKIIHYVWLGGQPLPTLGEKCLASWRTHLPDWEIRRWDERSSRIHHPFVQAMVRRKLYAFASDYIRLEVLLQEGGLYLDTDVEVLKDPVRFLQYSGLTVGLLTLQNRLAKCSIATSWVAAPAGNPWLKKIRENYDHLNRAVMNNTLFTGTLMPIFGKREIPAGGHFDFLEEEGVRLYHPDFFNPVKQEEAGRTVPEVHRRSVALHYGTGVWFGRQDPNPLLRRLVDLRLDRRIIRPIERGLKLLRKRQGFGRTAVSCGPVSIPNIVHYVWLGEKPLSPLGRKCLQSWKKFLPDWEIRRWDEKSSPVDHPFVKKMLAEKKYAFASDYIRLFALAEFGGLYLDTDLELIKDVRPVLNHPCVLAFLSAQNRPSKNSAAMGFFAAVPGHPWVLELQKTYDNLDAAVMNTTLTTQNLKKRGLKRLDQQSASQEFWDLGDIRIYHSDYFYPSGNAGSGYQCTFRTVGLHHAEGSWHGQAAPLSPWRRFLDLRLDRKILRPIEKALKRVRP